MFNRVAKGDIGVADRTEARVVAGDSGVCMRKKNMQKAKMVVQKLPKGHEAAGRQMRRPRLITGAGSLTDRVQADSQADLLQLSRDLRGPGKSWGAEL